MAQRGQPPPNGATDAAGKGRGIVDGAGRKQPPPPLSMRPSPRRITLVTCSLPPRGGTSWVQREASPAPPPLEAVPQQGGRDVSLASTHPHRLWWGRAGGRAEGGRPVPVPPGASQVEKDGASSLSAASVLQQEPQARYPGPIPPPRTPTRAGKAGRLSAKSAGGEATHPHVSGGRPGPSTVLRHAGQASRPATQASRPATQAWPVQARPGLLPRPATA